MKFRFVLGLLVVSVTGLYLQRERLNLAFSSTVHASTVIEPYTVHLREISKSVETIPPLVHDHIVAVRSDGSQLTIIRGPSREMPLGVYEAKEFRLAEGLYISTRNDTNIKTTRRRHPGFRDQMTWWVNTHRDPASRCLKLISGVEATTTRSERVAGEESIGGLRTVRIEDSSSGNLVVKWLALDLGCELVQQNIGFRVNSVESGTSEKRLVEYRRGEPNPALFAIPASFEEVGPTQAYLRYERLYRRDPNFDVPENRKDHLRRLEEQYAAARVN
jgi:hypothetical protein